MKKAMATLIGSVLMFGISQTALADTVFYCKSEGKVAEVTENNDTFNYKVTVEGKKKPVYNITKKRDQLGAYLNTGNGHNFSITIMFVDGDFSYQIANDKLDGKNYGSFEALRMGTSMMFGKCEPDSYVQKITSKEVMRDITIVD